MKVPWKVKAKILPRTRKNKGQHFTGFPYNLCLLTSQKPPIKGRYTPKEKTTKSIKRTAIMVVRINHSAVKYQTEK